MKQDKKIIDEILDKEFLADIDYIDFVRDEQIRQLAEMKQAPELSTIWPQEKP